MELRFRSVYAATQLGLAPVLCVVVEDAPVGVAAAIAAGMGSIGIGPLDRVGAANLVLPNLIGVHLTELQTKLDQTLKVWQNTTARLIQKSSL